MTSPIKQFVLKPIVFSAALFTVLTIPLAWFGSRPLNIQVQEEPVFDGKLMDVAPPYLGLAALLSLTVGTATVAMTGWRSADRNRSDIEAQLSGLEENLRKKEELLETLQLSDSRLDASGLKEFTSDKDTSLSLNDNYQPISNLEQVTSEPLLKTYHPIAETESVTEPVIITNQTVDHEPSTQSPTKPDLDVGAATARFPSVQSFLAYAPPNASQEPQMKPTPLNRDEFDQLYTKIQHLMSQMVTVKKAMERRSPKTSLE
ncbi:MULTISPECIES: hypothetical protein [unclassified Moorena]|uniref:hypothetical protein n=2 Tax=Moorena TaxID=1155738 RepID=UPI0013C7F671|nr:MULTISPECIES: hypothetical protein [unclassified Moorena]NEO21414.1 hypothetical protein [Moorena sp. SIO4A5]NEQ61977.1 hypothetical protein [Moorena sp. SIO4A1]